MTAWSDRMRSYAVKLVAALMLLAALVVAQGGVSVWIAGIATERVERGRIAADIHAGFLDLAWTKDRLRAWSLQVLLGTVPPGGDGERLSSALVSRVGAIRDLARRAEAMDLAHGSDGAEHTAREAALGALAPAFDLLRQAVLRLDSASPTLDPLRAWTTLERLFDVAADRKLGELLQESLDRENRALATKRAAADTLLNRLRALAIGATLLIAVIASLLAIGLAKGLRRPLAAITHGSQALREGRLDHRLPSGSHDEFGQLATSFNAMAAELEAHRKRERTIRQSLEGDVAERTRSLNDALADLTESEARRRRLVAEISHELRTPTTAIRGEAEIALRGGPKDAEAYRDTLHRIIDAAGHLGNVIDDLVTVARTDLNALVLQTEIVDFRKVVNSAVAQASAGAALRGVTLAARIEPHPLGMMGDAHRLKQMLGIVLDNAIRYSCEGGAVGVTATAHVGDGGGRMLHIAVVDDGIGIAEDEIAHVFDSQFRGTNARSHRPDGMGLGLTIARDLARRHGGDITITSAGTGTRVRIALPALVSETGKTGPA